MSKAVRIREHLYDEIERLAKAERRSIIGQLEVLLEQALRMEEAGIHAVHDGKELVGFALPPQPENPPIVEARAEGDPHFKPDPK